MVTGCDWAIISDEWGLMGVRNGNIPSRMYSIKNVLTTDYGFYVLIPTPWPPVGTSVFTFCGSQKGPEMCEIVPSLPLTILGVLAPCQSMPAETCQCQCPFMESATKLCLENSPEN